MSDAGATVTRALGRVFARRYRLIEPLGHPASDRVFRARDDILARDVAVKTFHVDSLQMPESPRSLAAARMLTRLDIPSLVTLYDAHVGRDGHGYLVMELISGPTLRDHLDENGPLPPEVAAALVADIARGLAAIHEVGIVHEHLSSTNTLLRPLRYPSRPFAAVLADFGVTRLLENHARSAPPEGHDYLPPEQLDGDAAQGASDIYALGLLALEALTGERPLVGGLLQDLVLAPLAYDPDIPVTVGYGWELLLTAMTARDPAARPTAAEVAVLASELREAPELLPAAEPVTDASPEPEPVPARRAVHLLRETATRRRRTALWTRVTHYR